MSTMKTIELNFFQTIAFTGLIVTLLSQGGLMMLEKHVEHFGRLYIVWLVVFMLGTALKLYYRHSDDTHQH